MAPLRERREEIPLLGARALKRCQKELPPDGPSRFSNAAMSVLCEGEYPGNVRQLEGIIERAYLLARKGGRDVIMPVDLLAEMSPALIYPRRGTLAEKIGIVRRALERTGGKTAAAARLLKVSRTTIGAVLASGRSSDQIATDLAS
jgi:DNA-binding NtrC family response regulator